MPVYHSLCQIAHCLYELRRSATRPPADNLLAGGLTEIIEFAEARWCLGAVTYFISCPHKRKSNCLTT
jgi:hypothetical protein